MDRQTDRQTLRYGTVRPPGWVSCNNETRKHGGNDCLPKWCCSGYNTDGSSQLTNHSILSGSFLFLPVAIAGDVTGGEVCLSCEVIEMLRLIPIGSLFTFGSCVAPILPCLVRNVYFREEHHARGSSRRCLIYCTELRCSASFYFWFDWLYVSVCLSVCLSVVFENHLSWFVLSVVHRGVRF